MSLGVIRTLFSIAIILLLCQFKDSLRIEVIKVELHLNIHLRSGNTLWVRQHAVFNFDSINQLCPGTKLLLKRVLYSFDTVLLHCKENSIGNKTREHISGAVTLYLQQIQARKTTESNWQTYIQDNIMRMVNDWFKKVTPRGTKLSVVKALSIQQKPMESLKLGGQFLSQAYSLEQRVKVQRVTNEFLHAYEEIGGLEYYEVDANNQYGTITFVMDYAALANANLHYGGPLRMKLLKNRIESSRLPIAECVFASTFKLEDGKTLNIPEISMDTCEGDIVEYVSLGADLLVEVDASPNAKMEKSELLEKVAMILPHLPYVDVNLYSLSCLFDKNCLAYVAIYVDSVKWIGDLNPQMNLDEWIISQTDTQLLLKHRMNVKKRGTFLQAHGVCPTSIERTYFEMVTSKSAGRSSNCCLQICIFMCILLCSLLGYM